MEDHNREVQIKMRFNRWEADALAKLAKEHGLSLAAMVRKLIHDAATK